ncbi:MAG: nucleotidyltransferase substrate binding protein, partial [Deltaproteobacteria bacterium]|nr:nucleotidyltransferase substrate binding protein [Deltaproteobacteria bacterium]
KDIRWMQRLENFETALKVLDKAVALSNSKELSELENQGLIQAFEFTHELAWNVLKDYFEYQGTSGITGSRDAIREAFSKGLLSDGAPWMAMIQSRNETTHTYNKKVSAEIVKKIRTVYLRQFIELKNKMNSLKLKS